MIKVEEGLKIVLNSIKRLIGTEVILLTNGQERILAADICADSAMPEFDNSAMDGYALRASDTKGASRDRPRALEVIEDLRAGYVSKRTLKGGQAIRIMTGAPIPKGSDSVIMVEDTKKIKNQKSKIKNKEFVRIFKEVKPGENVRKAGEDIKKGETVIKKGARLRPSHIGILASLGRSRIKVALRPKVAILATGDEVIDIDKKMRPGKIRNSNTYTLYSQVIKCGGVPKNLGIAKITPAN
jgi:molybdopterin molybdotransferase